MSNVLLSVVALFVGSMPGADTVPFQPVADVSNLFQDAGDSPVSPILDRQSWGLAPRINSEVVRGQNPGTYGPPMSPFGQPQYDPVMPYLNDPGPVIISGINGPQPYRMGLTPFFDAGFIAPSPTHGPGFGSFTVQEYDATLRNVSLIGGDWVFSNTFQGGTRLWNGPNFPDLPSSVFRFGWDFLLSTPQVGPWNVQFDFNPSVNSDFQANLGRESVNLDANVTGFYRVSPQLMLVLGVQYWDRVNDIIIPNAGVVWNPNDRLEMRLLFPKSRVSYFLGNFGDGAHWIYGTAEYHVESYQISVPTTSAQNQVQLSDWRVALGVRSDHQWYDKFVEVGYVFSRQMQFLHPTEPDVNIGGGVMVRLGVRF